VRMESTGLLLLSVAFVGLAFAATLRSLAPRPAEAVTTQGKKGGATHKRFQSARRQSPTTMPAAADHPPVEQPPQSEQWTEAEIAPGVQECQQLLAPLRAAYDFCKPIRTGQCGAPSPILLRRIANVEITPPTVVNCRIAAKLHE
jgi:hypothetical protein